MNRFSDARFIKSVYRPEELEETAAEVAFIGRSNVGKSTTINAICGKKDLARASKTPGRTRTINVVLVGKNKWIVDLPGYGFAVGPKDDWPRLEAMFKGYLLSRPSLRRVIMIVDGFTGASQLDERMAMWLDMNSLPFIIVANKCDRIASAKQQASRKAVADKLGRRPEDIRWVSAMRGLGMSGLSNEIADILELTQENRSRA
ncbi:MAG: ribosome biogenesis GTP-binding protein YsxC [Elusimicrobia bacterium RIFCSPLOWO2_01_FULL_54_10]|nr:MAG: ribosome biogenesis GTP-binding protein YsxC [Elusimicrobia bacterium RIFCSPLOWO2_01_FULL_54_10]